MTIDLANPVSGNVFAFLLIFCRIGSIYMLMPGIGDPYVPARIRLQLALFTSFVLLPLLSPQLPAMPDSALRVTEYILIEIGSGLFIGFTMRLLLSTLEVVGMLIALQIGLSNAMVLNPTIQSQGSITGTMMGMLGIVLLFESGLLDMTLKGFVQSYAVFKPGMFIAIGDMTHFISQSVNDSFSLALRLVAPFMILGIVFQLTGGLMVKMIPQMQIFFVLAPLQILFGLAVFAATIGSMMSLWGKGYEEIFMRIFSIPPIA
ncbi:MAG: flagellar biosynthetic protein FliR [Alphaproteobacteria bacterium]|nr:flagellar biosynthetic protein FliR [Alphaproteobacteria bacterium]